MWTRLLPWRFLVRRWAKGKGFHDPFGVLAQLQSFAQPSEVDLPVEILRMGSGLQVRGLINAQAIQHNLDWVWPYWVERQFDPLDPAFIPRSFSLSHLNLTHRNWTAIGIPNSSLYPIVDPAGLVTPFLDSWSIDCWIIFDCAEGLIPSRLSTIKQTLLLGDGLSVLTQAKLNSFHLTSKVRVIGTSEDPVCRIEIQASSEIPAWCVVSLRPYNPEGVSLVHKIELLKKHHGWTVNGKQHVYLNQAPDRCGFSNYRDGDIYHFLPHTRHRRKIICEVGLASAAVLYELRPNELREISVEVPLENGHDSQAQKFDSSAEVWSQSLEGLCELKIPDSRFQFLYEAAIRNMILHAPEEVYPGPYTYKHFWFRDAAFILNAMLSVGLFDRAERVINHSFFVRQRSSGYFRSQDGEWDSNGEALWTLMRFCQLTRKSPPPEWKRPIEKAVKWIQRKRIKENSKLPHAGLLPAGFSAEHFGPNDYYYWDDFWSVAGLAAAAYLLEALGKKKSKTKYQNQSKQFWNSVERSLETVKERLRHSAIPASPYRRMDSGAIGSLVASYPLQLLSPNDPRLLATVEYLTQNCLVDGGFFHDMSHSGINPYLTLHIAQVFLRSGDPRYYEIMKSVAALASPTGQWPEAIHPKTKGGCMGDGQHIWAAAEWVQMIRSCFVREEDDRLILCSGVPQSWIDSGEEIKFGPTTTKFGALYLTLKPTAEKITVSWKSYWFGEPPEMEIHLPGHEKILVGADQTQVNIPLMVTA